MAPKGCFENNFGNYSEEAACHILNTAKDGISEKFEVKLRNFKATKLQLLTTKMGSDIFHDGTVYTGSAGLALYYFMCSLGKNEVNHEFLKNAIPYLGLENLKGRKISFLCGDAGPLALATVISYKLGSRKGELPDYKILAQRLMALISMLNDVPDELLYGKCGYLYALLFVNKHIPGKETIPSQHIEKVISSILKSGKQYSMLMKSESPLLWQWHEKIYFGAAHGIAGILYMLLQAHAYTSIIDLRSFIKPSLDWLLGHKFPSGNFPSSLGSGSGDRLVQWCHGAPGFVPLCLLAHKVFEDDNYLRIALQCGETVWERGLTTKGYSICHGVSGNAYAFIQLYQATKAPAVHNDVSDLLPAIVIVHSQGHKYMYVGERVKYADLKWITKNVFRKPVHLYRACCFMEWCALERPGTELHVPDRPASLYEGLIGRLYLAEDLLRVSEAKFPAFTL